MTGVMVITDDHIKDHTKIEERQQNKSYMKNKKNIKQTKGNRTAREACLLLSIHLSNMEDVGTCSVSASVNMLHALPSSRQEKGIGDIFLCRFDQHMSCAYESKSTLLRSNWCSYLRCTSSFIFICPERNKRGGNKAIKDLYN